MDICPITQEEIKNEKKLSPCGHKFEKEAIDMWLNNNVMCPVCRAVVTNPIRHLGGNTAMEMDIASYLDYMKNIFARFNIDSDYSGAFFELLLYNSDLKKSYVYKELIEIYKRNRILFGYIPIIIKSTKYNGREEGLLWITHIQHIILTVHKEIIYDLDIIRKCLKELPRI